MGRTSRKLIKKTRLERLEVHINRLAQFNTNAMHEVGRLAVALRFYADPEAWAGHQCSGSDPNVKGANTYVVWRPEQDGPKIARDVLTSLGLPWDKMPVKGDPKQGGRDTVLNSLAADMKSEEDGLAEDDKRYEIGRYDEEGKPVSIREEAEVGKDSPEETEVVKESEEPPKTDNSPPFSEEHDLPPLQKY